MNLRIGLVCVVFGASASVMCAASAADKPLHTLRMKFKAGEQRRYEMRSKSELDFPGLPPQLAGGLRIRTELGVHVLSIEPNGAAKAKLTLGALETEPPMPVPGGGAKMIPEGCTLVIEPTAKAKLVAGSCGSDASLLPLIERMLSSFGFLPDKPVAVGAQWRTPIDMEAPQLVPGGKPAHLRGDALLTLRSIEKRGERRCAVVVMDGAVKLEAEMQQGMAHMTASLKGESCFDLDQGDWADGKGTMDMQIGFDVGGARMEGKSKSTMELKRLADGPIVNAAPPPAPKFDAPVPAPPPPPPAP